MLDVTTGKAVGALVLTMLGSGGFAHLLNRFFPRFKKVEQKAVAVAEELKPFVAAGVHDLKQLLALPELAPVKVELDRLKNDARNSKVDAVVRGLLNAYDTTLEQLTSDEKADVVLYAHMLLKATGEEVSPAEITAAMDASQKLTSEFANSALFKSTAEKEAIKAQLTSPPKQEVAAGKMAQPENSTATA